MKRIFGNGLERRLAGVAILAATVVLSAASAASAATASGTWRLWQLDGDRCWDAATLDANRNGYNEDSRFDLDNDCRWDTRVWNSYGGEALAESLTYDMDENGVAEYFLLDTNQRVGFEWIYLDLNQDRHYEQRRIVPGSDLDAITRTTTYNASSAILHQFTMRTGQSLLYPTFRMP
jgi:hypothetical protein